MMTVLKRSILFLLAALCCSTSINGQDGKAASMFFINGNYDAALKSSIAAIQKDSTDGDAWLTAGRSLVALNKNDSAIVCLEKAKQLKNAPDYVKAWAAFELSGCYFLLNDLKKARENNEACIKMDATKNCTNAAKSRWMALGFDNDVYSNWIIKETKHFTFHFQDTVFRKGLDNFLTMYEIGFDSINSFFGAALPKKIDMYIWKDEEQAQKLLGRPLAFTKSSLCVTHTSPKHTLGHEMTHTISNYATTTLKATKLISEGVCVAFDFSKRDQVALLKNNKQAITSVADIWRNSDKVSDGIIYPLGGELVKRLIKAFGKEKFLQFLSDQTYESAQKIYGAELDVLLKKLDEDLLVSK